MAQSQAQGVSAQESDAGALPPGSSAEAAVDGSIAPAVGSDAGIAFVPQQALVQDASVPPVPAVADGVEPSATAARVVRAPGTLRGEVVSAADESAVEGASVYVRGTPLQAQTDASGVFTLSVPAGHYQVSVILAGFSTQNVSNVEVRPGQTAVLNLKLQPGSVDLDEMVVVGSRIKGGIATLIAERRESKAVADVIGAEQMARSGDSNAATALARVTGITVIDGRYVIVRGMGERYSALTLNGLQVPSPDPTRRVVPLDIFPAGLIDSVVVQKTYSANLPGEFGGGLVQLRSRDYPHEFLFNINVATGGNFNTLFQDRLTYEGGKYDMLGVDDGTRALPSSFNDPRGKLVVENVVNEGMGYTEDEINALARQLPVKYNTHKTISVPDLVLGASVGNEWRLRHAKLGFVAGTGYRNELRNILGMYVNDNPDVEVPYDLNQYRRQISLSGFADWGVEFSARNKLKSTTMLLRQTDDTVQRRYYTGEDQRQQTILQWVERQVLMQQISGKHSIEKWRNFEADWRYAFGMATRVEPDRRTYNYALEDGSHAFQSGSGTNLSVFSNLKDKTHEAALDLAQPFSLWRQLQGKVRAGGLFYRRDRNADSRSFEFVAASSVTRDVPPNDVLSSQNIGNGVAFQEVTRPTDSYNAWMQLEAGYATLELPVLKSLDLSGGARLEHAHIDVETFDPFNPAAPPTHAKLDNLDVLPSAMATWRFWEDLQARLGYSRTLNRPDFRELSPSRYFDLENNLLLSGNPNVKRALIENFDARFEWYYTPDEVFSIGGFLKRFQDPIETKLVAGQEVERTVVNVDKAISYGLELEGRKRFGFISRVLKALYLSSNFSLIDSHVDVPLADGSTHRRPLQGQSPWVINAQLGWDDSDGTGTSASLLFNSAGKRIRFVGDPGQGTGDTYELPIYRMDFVFSQKLPKKIQLGARVRNILNAKETWTQDGVVVRQFRRGGDFQVSLSWSY